MPDKIVNHFVLADGSTAKYSAEHLAGDIPEVVGIRTGYDGTIYDSAGDAVRGQASDLHVDVNNLPVKNIDRVIVGNDNILDVNALKNGYINTSTGKVVKNSSQYNFDRYTDFLPVLESTKYYRTYSNVFEYDASKNFIQRANGAPGSSAFTTTASTKYIRVSLRSTVENLSIAFISNTRSAYYPYAYKFDGLRVENDSIINISELSTRFGILSLNDVAGKPIIDCENKKITIKAGTRVTIGQQRYSVNSDVDLTLTIGTATIKYVVFDVSLGSFKLVNATGEASINDNCFLVMVACFGDTNFLSVKSVFCTCDYLITGTQVKDLYTRMGDAETQIASIEASIPDLETYFYPTTISDWYVPYGTDFDKFTLWSNPPAGSSYRQTVAQDYYDAMDELIEDYPDYVTKTLVSMDQTNTYPIYKYDFNPAKPQFVTSQPSFLTPKKFPKILLTGGLHGDEKNSPFGIYYLIRDVLTHWQDNDLLEYLRFNVRLIVIPIVNPYGFNNPNTQQGSRYNGRHVNINRNFNYNWSAMDSDPTSANYRGESPASEQETKNIIEMVEDNQDALYYLDYHTNGSSGTEPLDTMWHIYPVSANLYNLQPASEYHIATMSRKAVTAFGQPNSNPFYGYTSFADTANVYNWSTLNGVPCTTLECPRKFVTENVFNSNEVNKFATEMLGNWLGMVLMNYKS